MEDIKNLVDRLLDDAATHRGFLNTGQPVTTGKGKSIWLFNGSLFIQRNDKSETFVGVVTLKDGRHVTVTLDTVIQQSLRALPPQISIEQLCAHGDLTIRKQSGSYHFEASASGIKITPKFQLETLITSANQMGWSSLGVSNSTSTKVRQYTHLLSGRQAYRYTSPANKIATVDGTTFEKTKVGDWLEASLENYWAGVRSPEKKDLFAVPPAYWGGEERKVDMRYIILSQYWNAAKELAQAAGCKFTIPEPSLEFEGFWAPYELRPAVKVVPPAPPVVLPKIVVPTVVPPMPPRVIVAVPTVLPK